MATDKTDPSKPTGLRGVFLKKETPPDCGRTLQRPAGFGFVDLGLAVFCF